MLPKWPFTTEDISITFWGSFFFIRLGFNGISKVLTDRLRVKSEFAELAKQ